MIRRGISSLPELAEQFGVGAIITEYRKPNAFMMSHLPLPKALEVVVEDRVFPNELFTSCIKASFVCVEHLTAGTKSWLLHTLCH